MSSDLKISPVYGDKNRLCGTYIALEQSATTAELRKEIEKVTGLSTSAYEISSYRSAAHHDTWTVFGDKIDITTLSSPYFNLVYSPYRDGKQGKGPIRIHITPEDSVETVTVECEPNCTFDELGDRIQQEVKDIPRRAQHLYSGEIFLDPVISGGYTLSSLRIMDVSCLRQISLVFGKETSALTWRNRGTNYAWNALFVASTSRILPVRGLP